MGAYSALAKEPILPSSGNEDSDLSCSSLCYLAVLLEASHMFLMKVQEFFSFPKLWRKPHYFIAEATPACIAGKSEIFFRCIDPNVLLSKLLSEVLCRRKHKVMFLCSDLSGWCYFFSASATCKWISTFEHANFLTPIKTIRKISIFQAIV